VSGAGPGPGDYRPPGLGGPAGRMGRVFEVRDGRVRAA
jgi:hypothetical protein